MSTNNIWLVTRYESEIRKIICICPVPLHQYIFQDYNNILHDLSELQRADRERRLRIVHSIPVYITLSCILRASY